MHYLSMINVCYYWFSLPETGACTLVFVDFLIYFIFDIINIEGLAVKVFSQVSVA